MLACHRRACVMQAPVRIQADAIHARGHCGGDPRCGPRRYGSDVRVGIEIAREKTNPQTRTTAPVFNTHVLVRTDTWTCVCVRTYMDHTW